MNDVIENNSKATSKAKGKMIRISPYKLNLEAKSIRGKKVDEALSYLEFSKKRISLTVKAILESAIANAENNHALDIDKLYVDEAYVGKDMVMKRWRARARGRAAKILKPFSQLTIVLKEKDKKVEK
ncbi:MAG: 50S ribosomal protein L22 [Pseudomonadota bacterium]|nr:50S ribosomal protein L22 [Pseudomonadota bacterium]MEC9414129.1 50S ribosomal protein L22 [Pseudomonadota bacterium]|tara:strand:- start:1163 stop:1543 length:381 start_codon:yes stop_codon:yes gene_type:complete